MKSDPSCLTRNTVLQIPSKFGKARANNVAKEHHLGSVHICPRICLSGAPCGLANEVLQQRKDHLTKGFKINVVFKAVLCYYAIFWLEKAFLIPCAFLVDMVLV